MSSTSKVLSRKLIYKGVEYVAVTRESTLWNEVSNVVERMLKSTSSSDLSDTSKQDIVAEQYKDLKIYLKELGIW